MDFIYDGFESKSLSNIWNQKLLAPNSFEIQSKVVRSGKSAIKIVLNPGDNFQPKEKSSKATERNELVEQKELISSENQDYSYKFSIFLPEDFPIVDTRLVLAQWKQKDENNAATIDNPILALRYVNGELFITLQTTEKKNKIFSTTEEIRGKWLDFKFEVKFSRKNNGFIHIWLNNKQIVTYSGETAYNKAHGYPLEGKFYFKMGLYRDCMNESMTVYFDDYNKTQSINNS